MQYDRVSCQDVKCFQIKWYRASFGSLDAQMVCLVSVFVSACAMVEAECSMLNARVTTLVHNA